MQIDWPCQGLPHARYSTHLGELVPGTPHHPSSGDMRTRAQAHLHKCLLAAAWSTAGQLDVRARTGVGVREVRPASEGVYACVGACIHVQ